MSEKEKVISETSKSKISKQDIYGSRCIYNHFFKKHDYVGTDVAEKLFELGLCLPSDSKMTDEELQIVCNVVKKFVMLKKTIYTAFFKDFLDIVLSVVALIILSPVMLVLGILVRCKLGSSVLFTQERPGKNEKIFKLYKFRTMTNKTDVDGNLLPDADRLTKFGKFIRSTSLDELPSLFNIIKGDMSIVGPRPLLVGYLPLYSIEQKEGICLNQV